MKKRKQHPICYGPCDLCKGGAFLYELVGPRGGIKWCCRECCEREEEKRK